MKKTLLCLFLVGCAPVKTVHVKSNVDVLVNVNGETVCQTTDNCKIKIPVYDSAQKNFSIVNKKNYFSKYFTLNGSWFETDTTIFVMF